MSVDLLGYWSFVSSGLKDGMKSYVLALAILHVKGERLALFSESPIRVFG